MKRIGVLAIVAVGIAFAALAVDPVVEYAFKDAVSLDGDWEMAYSPHFLEVCTYPQFEGKMVGNAVPGYWEDMIDAFRLAGINDRFRINPEYTERSLPQKGWAPDTQLPQPYGTFFYRRKIVLERTGRAVLAFEGVRNQVHVWVNGRFVELYCGYSTPFTIAIPDGYLKVGENEITLAVANKLNTGYIGADVRGLTSRALFRATGGVNGHLELQFVHGDLRNVAVTTAADLKHFTIHTGGSSEYAYRICDGAEVLAEGTAKGDCTLPSERFEFWTPENPKLYALVLRSGEHEYSQRFGLRRLAASGCKLFLNGSPVYLRGITEHCYYAESVHLPRSLEYYRMVAKKRKELGFNFVRFHTFVPPVEYLQATDELGMMVEMESPNFVTEAQYASIIAFARRHPSVVMYSTGNETRIDRLVEAYLREIADMVHSRTDSLFSPMSALRGVSYLVFKDLEPVVRKPYAHNEERAARLAAFSDLFNACSNSSTSYDYFDGYTAEGIDSWSPFYCNKPRLLHETCIDGTYADLTLEAMYPKDSPIAKTKLFSEVRRVLTEKGIVDRAAVYFTNSCAWVALGRKYAFEKARACETVAGFDFLGDINTHWHTYGYSVGMMDEFYRLKPRETVERVLAYNSPAVLLADFNTTFVFEAGSRRKTVFSLSNFADVAARGTLSVQMRDESGRMAFEREIATENAAFGHVSKLAEVELVFPNAADAHKYTLDVRFATDAFAVSNRWDCYAFPTDIAFPEKHAVSVVRDISRDDLLAAMARGERVVLLGKGPFKSSPMTFCTGRAGRCSGNFATVIKDHPALEGFPHEDFCAWQFRMLMHEARVVQLETDVPFDPIIDVASAVKYPIRQAAMFEYRVGTGRLLVASFNFRESDPAAVYLKALLRKYAASDRFEPKDGISVESLAALIDAPEVKTTANPNRAMNPGDPSAYVRTGLNLMP